MPPARTLALILLSAAILSGCKSADKAPAETAPAAEAAKPAKPAPTGTANTESRIVSLPFRVDVSFSEGALDRIRTANADLGVSADYYGPPKDKTMTGLDPDLGVWLGGEMVTIDPGQRSVTFKGQVDAARVAREVAGDARVRVMVFPVRAYSVEAAVTCSEFDEYLPITVETGATVHCTLNGE